MKHENFIVLKFEKLLIGLFVFHLVIYKIFENNRVIIKLLYGTFIRCLGRQWKIVRVEKKAKKKNSFMITGSNGQIIIKMYV